MFDSFIIFHNKINTKDVQKLYMHKISVHKNVNYIVSVCHVRVVSLITVFLYIYI